MQQLLETIFWTTAGGIGAGISANIFFHFVKPRQPVAAMSRWIAVGATCGLLRGYTGKSIWELLRD